MRSWIAGFAALTAVCAVAPAYGQEPAAADDAALRVFIDCPDYFCDMDYLRTETPFLGHVRNRQDADVHVLITTQRTGAGGIEFTLAFIGLGGLRDVSQTLRYVSPPAEAQDVIRRELVRAIHRGLVPFAVRTPLGERLQVTYAAPSDAAAAAPQRDPWDNWTFRTGVSGFASGESSFQNYNVNLSFSANRITPAWKVTSSVNARQNESSFEISEDRTIVNIQRNYGVSGLAVRSLGSQLSAGMRGSATSSTFLNQRLAARLAPAVEYNFFPYAESTRRQLTAQYSVGATHFDYREETIFERMQETRFDQRILLSLSLKQPWGSVSAAAEGGHYLHDFSKQRGVLFGNTELRLIRGLSLQTFGSLELVRDQLHLPRRGASEEEILLRQRQLATSYRYWASVGLSYTFGSTYTSVVNPRFGGASGGMIIMN
jgi:hypothetical protein